jgi:EmrB/QacA subfamily drug resistance transporter
MSSRLLAEENRKWWTLVTVSAGLFMIIVNTTVVVVALPSIQRDLHVPIASVEWIVTVYVLTVAALVLTGGKLADMFGRRKIYVVGLVVFTASSLACGLAPNAGFLIGARALQGVGAALMTPATLSIITATFPARQRGQAFGIWSGVAALALVVGPLTGGLIVDNINWHWVFFINVPVGLAAIAASQLFIAESRDASREQSIDVPGLVTSGLALLALSWALIEGNRHGWSSPEILFLFAAAALLAGAFVLVEHRQQQPMLDLSLFRTGMFAGANTVALLSMLVTLGVMTYVALYVQNILGYTPTQAGATFLPTDVLIILVAPLAGRQSDRIGSRWLIAAGMTLFGITMLLYMRAGVRSSYWSLLPQMVCGGVAIGLTSSPTTAAAMGAVSADKSGVGAGVLNSFRQVGAAMGIPLMGAILASYLHAPPHSALGKQKYVDGMHAAMLVGALIAFVAAGLAAVLIRTSARAEIGQMAEVAA